MSGNHMHLEGMGLMGSLTARWLAAHGREFTWNDKDSDRVSWKASTGLVFPTGHKLDNAQLEQWKLCYDWGRKIRGEALPEHTLDPEHVFFKDVTPHLERGIWCFYSKGAPHGGKAKVVSSIGGVNVSNLTTMHLNAQTLVTEARQRWNTRRNHFECSGPGTLVTHGFHPETIGAWSWGWSAKVRLTLDPAFGLLEHRPCFYLRDGFILDYLYPVPNTDQWYAGTSLITQKYPTSRPLLPKYRVWETRVSAKSAGAFEVEQVSDLQEAWRPIPKDGLAPLTTNATGTTFIRPQYGSGIRHWWVTADALTKEYTL